MSNLDLVRSLRRALAGLRDATDSTAADQVARSLACELELKLGQSSRLAGPSDVVRTVDGDAPWELGMAVCA
jgi:hypothetical protein